MSERHTNTQHETIEVAVAGPGPFQGAPLLVIHDDPPPVGTGTRAPMLLDAGTRRWLRAQLDRLDEDSEVTP